MKDKTVAFQPQHMKMGILTAALQELTPRDVRDEDPDRAVEDWLSYAQSLGADYIQLSAGPTPNRDRCGPRGDAGPGCQHLGLAGPV